MKNVVNQRSESPRVFPFRFLCKSNFLIHSFFSFFCKEVSWLSGICYWIYKYLHQGNKWEESTNVDQRPGGRNSCSYGSSFVTLTSNYKLIPQKITFSYFTQRRLISFWPVTIQSQVHWLHLALCWLVTRKFKTEFTTSSWTKLINMCYHSTCTSCLKLSYWWFYLELKCREMCATKWFRTYHTSTIS